VPRNLAVDPDDSVAVVIVQIIGEYFLARAKARMAAVYFTGRFGQRQSDFRNPLQTRI